ncbi:hypothetical protein Tco_0710873 [Tanacetum coccineum]
METSREALWECIHLERVQDSWKEVQWRQREEKMSRIREQVILKTKNSSGGGPNSGPVSLEKIWDREDTEEVFTISHESLDQYVIIRTMLTTDCKQLLTKVLWENMEEGMIRKVRHPMWVANTIPVKLANGTWKVQVDYSSLNKVCAKDMYPFSEEGEGLASIMGYTYKYFL